MEPLLYPDLYRRLDEELRYRVDERAAIAEFEGRQARETAEYIALVDLLREHPGAFLGFRTLRLDVDGRPLWIVASPRVADELCTHRAARYADLAGALAEPFRGLAVLSDCPEQLREFQHLI